jgi:ketosteroid isomerase-like protein
VLSRTSLPSPADRVISASIISNSNGLIDHIRSIGIFLASLLIVCIGTSKSQRRKQMKQLLTAGLTAILVTLAAGCNQTSQQSAATHDADVKAITADMVRWQSDFNTRDLEKALTHYAADAVVVIPGAPAAGNAEARRALIKEMMSDPALHMTSTECPRVEVSGSGDYGYAQCTYAMTITDPVTKKPMNDRGNVVDVYKKQTDGSWKSVSDIATSEVPPPAPLSPAGK